MKGILLIGNDKVTSGRAAGFKLQVETATALPLELPFEKTLIVEAGLRVPFDYLPAAWEFLERWDAAVPLWRYTVTAAQVGTESDRAATQAVIRDLRVLLHATEFLFVRRNEAGTALWAAWLEELEAGGDRRLAFLRAVYRVKPRLCVLPTSWLVPGALPAPIAPPKEKRGPLVSVEVAPGRFVKVHKGDEERVRAQFARQRKGRVRNAN